MNIRRNYLFLLIVAFVFISVARVNANPTKPVIDGGANPILGWERDGTGKITVKIWLDSLTAEQKRVFKLAIDQWVNWKTADTTLSGSNYGKENKDVMTDEPQGNGETGRNLSETDKAGMDKLYKDTTINVTYVDSEVDSNYQVILDNTISDLGYGSWKDSNGDDYIDKGKVQIGNLPAGHTWYYVTDSDGDGKITNKDTNGTAPINSSEYDFYSLVKHEIGHTLGFDHSVVVPAPSALLLAFLGTASFSRLRRRIEH